jgi:hypothetical protein
MGNSRDSFWSWSGSRRRSAYTCLLLCLAGAYVGPVAAQNFDPADILNGKRYMKQTQDVSFVSVYPTDYDFVNVDVITYFTSNSQFSGTTPSVQQTIASTDLVYNTFSITPTVLPSQSAVGVASGRMFNTANDQFVALNPNLAINLQPEADWMFSFYDPPAPNANPPRSSSLQTIQTGNNARVAYVGGT